MNIILEKNIFLQLKKKYQLTQKRTFNGKNLLLTLRCHQFNSSLTAPPRVSAQNVTFLQLLHEFTYK